MRSSFCIEPRPGDPVARFLETAQIRLVMAQISDHTAPWFYRCSESLPGFYVVTRGGCRLWPDGAEESLSLGTGDLVVLLRGQSHWLQHPRKEPVRDSGAAPETRLLRVRFTWKENKYAALLPEMPAIVHFRGEDSPIVPWMARVVQLMKAGAVAHRPGTRALLDHLAWMVCARSLRAGPA